RRRKKVFNTTVNTLPMLTQTSKIHRKIWSFWAASSNTVLPSANAPSSPTNPPMATGNRRFCFDSGECSVIVGPLRLKRIRIDRDLPFHYPSFGGKAQLSGKSSSDDKNPATEGCGVP